MGVKKHQDGAPLIPQSGKHGPVEKPKNLLDDDRHLVVFSASPAAPPSQASLSVIGDPRLWSGERMWWGGVGAVSRIRVGRLGSVRCTCCRCYLPTSRLCSCARPGRMKSVSSMIHRGKIPPRWHPSQSVEQTTRDSRETQKLAGPLEKSHPFDPPSGSPLKAKVSLLLQCGGQPREQAGHGP